jgi:DNA-directed RNA polymerase specialized sigma24 family protein
VKRSRRHPANKLDNEQILEDFELDEDHRKVAECYYLDGKTVTDIAATLDTDEEQVEACLKFVRGWLQKHRYRPTSPAGHDVAMEASIADRPIDMLLCEELVISLEEKLRDTVVLKLQGHSNHEIADELDVSERQVQRRLKLVRDLLEAELTGEEAH